MVRLLTSSVCTLEETEDASCSSASQNKDAHSVIARFVERHANVKRRGARALTTPEAGPTRSKASGGRAVRSTSDHGQHRQAWGTLAQRRRIVVERFCEHGRMSRALAGTAVGLLVLLGWAASASPRPPEGPYGVVWAPSEQIVFTTWGGGIYVVSPSGGRARLLASGERGVPSVTRDGRLVYWKDSSLFTIPLAGGKPRSLGFGFEGVWSPDGKRIAYKSHDGVMVGDADGSHKRLVATNRYWDLTGPPTWSPDGRKLAYVACRAPFQSDPCENQFGYDVYVVGLDGSDKHRVTPRPGNPQCPAWSSVGKLAFSADIKFVAFKLVAVVQKGGGLRTFRPGGVPSAARCGRRAAADWRSRLARAPTLLNFDGSYRKRITVAPRARARSTGVAWSPDGKWLAIIDGSLPRSHLWVVRANGYGLKRLL